MTQAYPLHWPTGQARTAAYRRRENPHFSRNLSVMGALRDVQEEVRRLNGRDLVVSSNIKLRIDGLPRSDQRIPDDPGVAVYFERKAVRLAFACDKYDRPEHNLRAIAMHLEALRGMERWGVGSLDQAFAGYQALPDPDAPRSWWDVLGMSLADVQAVRNLGAAMAGELLLREYRNRAKTVHPDAGGTQEAFVELQQAYEAARRELGVA